MGTLWPILVRRPSSDRGGQEPEHYPHRRSAAYDKSRTRTPTISCTACRRQAAESRIRTGTAARARASHRGTQSCSARLGRQRQASTRPTTVRHTTAAQTTGRLRVAHAEHTPAAAMRVGLTHHVARETARKVSSLGYGEMERTSPPVTNTTTAAATRRRRIQENQSAWSFIGTLTTLELRAPTLRPRRARPAATPCSRALLRTWSSRVRCPHGKWRSLRPRSRCRPQC